MIRTISYEVDLVFGIYLAQARLARNLRFKLNKVCVCVSNDQYDKFFESTEGLKASIFGILV